MYNVRVLKNWVFKFKLTYAGVDSAGEGVPAHLHDSQEEQPEHDAVLGAPEQVVQGVVVPRVYPC